MDTANLHYQHYHVGEHILVSPSITGKESWIDGQILEVEKNPFNGIVLTVKTDTGEIFFNRVDYFKTK